MRAALTAIVMLLAGVAAAGPAALADPENAVDLLYASQVYFDSRGVPRVTIGMAENQSRVSLSSRQGMTLEFVEDAGGAPGVSKTLNLPPGATVTADIVVAHPARIIYYVGVARLAFEHKAASLELADHWRQRGEHVQLFETGSVLGLAGQVIDNRTIIVALRPQASERLAARAAEQLFTATGTRSFVHHHLETRPGGVIRVADESGMMLALARDLVRAASSGPEPLHVVVEAGQQRREFELAGETLITFDRQGLLVVVNRIDVERLLAGLVPAEIPASAHPQALRAQAVVARGEVFAKLGARHFLDPYLLCATTHCQVYGGAGIEDERTTAAVAATEGQVLFLEGHLVDTVYSASCGGHGENNEDVWSDPPSPALRGKPDLPEGGTLQMPDPQKDPGIWLAADLPAYCRNSSLNRPGVYRWEKVLTAAELEELVNREKPIGRVVALQVLERGVSGRAKLLRVVGERGELLVQRELAIRRLLGGLKSALFTVEVRRDEKQLAQEFVFRGGGWGHGVGLCQIGAVGMAEAGYDYRRILAHYYNGAQVVRLYGGGE